MQHDSQRIYCMDCDPITKKVFMNKCDAQSTSQKWDLGFVNRTMTDNWEKYGAKII
jgi:hypothetical protein